MQIIHIETTNKRTGILTSGKLTLVDLAGSERAGKTGAEGDTLKEAMSINKSLSALGDVIGALTAGASHVPYRNHVLTELMSDSLGGSAKTLMFVNISPADYNSNESKSSLQVSVVTFISSGRKVLVVSPHYDSLIFIDAFTHKSNYYNIYHFSSLVDVEQSSTT
jgi:hypothetical protein